MIWSFAKLGGSSSEALQKLLRALADRTVNSLQASAPATLQQLLHIVQGCAPPLATQLPQVDVSNRHTCLERAHHDLVGRGVAACLHGAISTLCAWDMLGSCRS